MKKFSVLILQSLIAICAVAQVPQLSLVQLATAYASPVDIKTCGDQRLFIVEQKGIIRILYKDGSKQTTPFLNIDARVNNYQDEQGLLGLAFSPNYKQDGFFYVQYTSQNTAGTNAVDSIRVSRFSVMAGDSTQADPNSEQVLISFHDLEWNHNGGNLMFGPDGYLYITEGDGGSGSDPDGSHGVGGNGQNKNVWFGKMLRIDVTNQASYSVPASNPFVGVANTKPEIWAYGLRNPWRCSFDKITGDMWIGDVGQDAYEEIDFQTANSTGGQNYGWRCREGFHACPNCSQTGCTGLGYTDPVFELAQSGTAYCGILGGYVYRGTQYGKFFGRYIFTDYCSSDFFSLLPTGPNTFDQDTLAIYPNFQYYTSFGQDNLGELYVSYRGSTSSATGRIYKITETSDCKPAAFITLSDTITACKPITLTALQGDTLSYQWYNVNGSIGGATSNQFSVPQTGWYKVKVSKTLHAGCEAFSDSVYVVANDTDAITIAPVSLQYCINASPVNIDTHVSPSGGVLSGSGVSGINIIPSAAGVGTVDVTYQYTNAGSCVSTVHFPVIISDTVVLTAIGPFNYCVDESAVSLGSIVLPAGGTYSGSSVANDSVFNPNSAGVGAVTVSYQYIESINTGCVSQKSVTLNVGGATALTKTVGDSIYCNTGSAVSIVGFISPAGGVFSGTGVSGNSFDPAGAFVGYNKIWYQYTNSFGCISIDSFELRLDNCVGIKELENEISFRVFPNPSKGNFNLDVKVNAIQQAEIVITDAVGKVCYRKNQLLDPAKPIIALPLSLATGVYAVQLKANKQTVTKSLVVE